MKIGKLIEKIADDERVDDYDIAKSINTMLSHFKGYVLLKCKRVMNDAIGKIGGFFSNSFYYTDTDSLYLHMKHWSDLVNNGFVGKPLGLGKLDYGNSIIFYACSSALKIRCCLVIDDFGVISAKRFFEGYSEENRIIKLAKIIYLSQGKTVPGRFSIGWTETFEGKRNPHRKQNCLDCNSGKNFSDCVKKT